MNTIASLPAPARLSPADARAFATAQLDRLMGFYPRIDGKASFLLALNVSMLGLMALNFPVRDMTSPRGLAGILAAIALFLALWRLGYVFFPHLAPGERMSLIYFRDIALDTWRNYHQALTTTSEDALLEDLSCQIWRNSKILRIKYDETQLALKLMVVALLPWLLLLLAAALRAGKFLTST